ncbi:MAG: hypothetical protein K0M66_14105 [Thiobacillus sp.]|nr:hypothetical protein [Thiobacillus sp.]
MATDSDAARDHLVAALKWFDDEYREQRADRITWLSGVQFQPQLVAGPLDTMSVLEEARVSFINGLFIAAQLLAAAFIEHALVDELTERGLAKPGIGFQEAIHLARSASLFEPELLAKAERVRQLRNPFTHRKGESYPHSFGSRFIEQQKHPTSILEGDAKFAMEAMYAFFRAVARAGA